MGAVFSDGSCPGPQCDCRSENIEPKLTLRKCILSLSLLLLNRASVVLESTEGAMEKIPVASTDGSVSFPTDEMPSDRVSGDIFSTQRMYN